MTTRFASGREVLVGHGIPQPVPITLAPAAYAGAFAYGEDNVMYYCDGSAWIHADGRRSHRMVSSVYTPILADAGRVISTTAGGVIIPLSVFSLGHKFSVFNNSSLIQDIVPAAGVTLYLSGTAATGPQILGPRGFVEVECVGVNVFVVSGVSSVLPNVDSVTLVAPNFFSPLLTMQRAQLTGVQSSAVNGSDNGLTLYGADVPRFSGVAQRLLIEGQQTNTSPNPNCEGAVPGTPGTLPSSWIGWLSGSGLTREVVGSGNENGIPFVDIRISGTTTDTSFFRLLFQFTTAEILVVTNGDRVASSVYVRLVSGSTAGVNTFRTSTFGRDLTEEFVGGQIFQQNFTPTPNSLNSQRRVGLYQVTDASVLYAVHSLDFTFTSGAVIDFTVRVGSPQIRLGAFADTDVFPPVETPGASTRGDDRATALLNALGISGNGACTVLWSGVIPAFVPGGIHTIVCVDDASVSNRLTLRVNQADGQCQAIMSFNGPSITSILGAVTAGVPFKVGMTYNGAGRLAASLNGGTAADGTIITSNFPVFTHFRLGNIVDLSTPLFGETARLRVVPYPVTDIELESLVGGLP